MGQVPARHQAILTQSYRFGEAISGAATSVLRELGAEVPLRGLQGLESHIAEVVPNTILCRTNGGVIGNVLRFVAAGKRCHVLGGTKALESLLTDVQKVKQGMAARSPELLGFHSWKAVMSFSLRPEGEYLRGLVNLVQEYGEANMLRGLAGCEADQAKAEVVCSTAHKAKGREWRHIAIDDDFRDAILRSARGHSTHAKEQKEQIKAELKLFYVALTRAQSAVQIPPALLSRFRLTRTTDALLGGDPVKVQKTGDPSQPDLMAGVVSPYHSPEPGESRRMAALWQILRNR
ncbi:MAG: helicase, superfamily [Acidobacteriaceae bacterium]|nr:helicase, superfamily [Acidobacteriaceae bacterium]